jgi:inosose dehydratase
MKLAYGTYALQRIEPIAAVAGVKEIGYDAIEVNCGEQWPTAPEKLDSDARGRLRDAIQSAGFPSPPLMNILGLCAHDEDVDKKLRLLEGSCRLAGDLSVDERPKVLTTTLGDRGGIWDETRGDLVQALQPYIRVAEDHGVILALEAHAGQQFDSPDKCVWLMQAVDRPSVRVNFDHSHFHVNGLTIEYCARVMAPYTVHSHLKDGRIVDGEVRYLLPGDGELNLQRYFRAVSSAGIDVAITIEVTAQIWASAGYDPWATARVCYARTAAAMAEAGVA